MPAVDLKDASDPFCCCDDVMSVADAVKGEALRIVSLRDCGSFEHKLNGMGIYTGADVLVVHKVKNGAMILARRNARIAIGPEMAERMKVVKISSEGGLS
ncbi:MAG: FeoA family protein [Alphaproteobacteria bacterium]